MSDQGWAAPDRPGRGTPSYADDWPDVPTGRPPLPPDRPRITLPPHIPPVPPPVRPTGGLFPVGPPRPIYREVHPVRLGPLAAGAASAALWMLLFGLLATTARGYAWLTFGAGAAAWLGAAVLARFGDRGVAVGVAVSAAVGVAVAGIVVIVRWVGGDWLLW